jgi:hypothetical protein
MLSWFADTSGWTGPQNILHTIFDPARLRPHIADWDALAVSLVHRIYREAVGRHVDPKTVELLDSLLAYPNVPAEWKTPKGLGASLDTPVVPLALTKNGKTLRLFSMVTTVGTPQTVAGQEVRLEWMLPVDEESEAIYQTLLQESVC